MKKWIALLLAVIMCLSVVACGESKKDETSKPDINDAGSDTTTDAGVSEDNEKWLVDGNKINADRLRDEVQIVEITTENWREYLKVYYTTYTSLYGDGTIKEEEGYVFGAGNERYHYYELEIKLKNKETDQVHVRQWYSWNTNDGPVEEGFNLDDYECISAEGYIYFWDFPIGSIPADVILDPETEDPNPNKCPNGLRARKGTNYIKYEYWDHILGV